VKNSYLIDSISLEVLEKKLHVASRKGCYTEQLPKAGRIMDVIPIIMDIIIEVAITIIEGGIIVIG